MIEQSFHGYDQGHRLLASSVAITSAEAALLDRLSDLSGFLPPGTPIPPYLTLYPCGRFFAIARTWPDTSGSRSGTVLTHTLLVPLEDAISHESLAPFWSVHRRPNNTADRDPYRESIAAPAKYVSPWAPVGLGDPFDVVAGLLLSQMERPVALVSAEQHEDAIDRTWRLLWRSARGRFAACTFALGIRSTERGPFDLLIVPPAARAAVTDVARVSVLLEPLRGEALTVAGVHDQPWFATVLADAPAWRDDVDGWCREHGLTLPFVGAMARLERLRAFDKNASERITAARGRLNALSSLWPTLSGAHEYLRESVRTLIRHQHTAPEAPSPLRSLVDLVQRLEVQRVAQVDPEIERMMVAALRDEVAERIHRHADAAFAELDSLFTLARTSAWRLSIVAGTADAIVQESEDGERIRWIEAALKAAGPRLRVVLGAELLKALPPNARLPVLERDAAELDDRHRRVLARIAIGIAARSRDTPLMMYAYGLLGREEQGIRRALELVLAEEGPSSRALERIENLPLESRVDWTLGPVAASWREFAVEHGSRWLIESGLAPSVVAARSGRVDHGAELLLRWLDRVGDSGADAVLADITTVKRLILHILLDVRHGAMEGRGHEVVAQRAPAVVSDSDVQTALVKAGASAAGVRVMTYVAPLLVRDIVSGTLEPALTPLYDAPAWSRWLALCEPNVLRNEVGSDTISRALPHAWKALTTLSQRAAGAAVSEIVVACIREADRGTLDSAQLNGARWFTTSSADGVRERLAAEILVAVRSKLPQSASAWLESCFVVAYAPLVGGERNPFDHTAWRPGYGEWDVARNWREWLVSTWLDERWPADRFLRALKDDRRLLDECCASIRYRYGRLEFVESLLHASRTDPTLREWRAPVERWYDEFKPFWRR